MTVTRLPPPPGASGIVKVHPDETAKAVLTPGKMPVNLDAVDMSIFHQSHGHLREVLLRETAK